MTENLAGRGEGLKELDELREIGAALTSTNALRGRQIIGLATRIESRLKLLAALEAAAPAGTDGVCPICYHSTQEPAGSGASEQRIQELAMVLAKRVLRVTRVDITSADSEEKARELLTLLTGPLPRFIPLTPEQIKANEKETVGLGSPRKVGEDGAAQRIIEKCEQYWNEPNICDAEIHAVLEFIHREARALRPSSAPMGEQK